MENICEQCGTRNEPGVQFCVSCQAFLPWDDENAEPVAVAAPPIEPPPASSGGTQPTGGQVGAAPVASASVRTTPVVTAPVVTAPVATVGADSAANNRP
jgi:hypothetical protein